MCRTERAFTVISRLDVTLYVRHPQDHGKNWSPPVTVRGDGDSHDTGYPRSFVCICTDGKIVTAYAFHGPSTPGATTRDATIWNPGRPNHDTILVLGRRKGNAMSGRPGTRPRLPGEPGSIPYRSVRCCAVAVAVTSPSPTTGLSPAVGS